MNDRRLVLCLPVIAVLAGAWPAGADPSETAGMPKLVVPRTVIDLGDLKEDTKTEATYFLTNRGDADLRVLKVKGHCGCAAIELTEEDKVIPPGDRRPLKVIYNSRGRAGPQETTVDVYTNDPDRPIVTLGLKANVVQLVTVSQNQQLLFRSVRRGDVIARTLRVLPLKPGPRSEIVSFEIPGGTLRCQPEPITRGDREGYELVFTARNDAPLGPYLARADLVVKLGEVTETKTIRIQGEILGELTATPGSIRGPLERASPRGFELRPLTVSAVSDAPFNIEQAQAPPGLDVTVEAAEPGTKYIVRLRIREDAGDGPHGGYLDLTTDNASQPLMRVPVYFNVAPRLSAEPPVVRFDAADPAGEHRQVLLRTPTLADFAITATSCDHAFVQAELAESAEKRPGIRAVNVRVVQRPPPGRHEATVILRTDVPGAEEFRIPVLVTVP